MRSLVAETDRDCTKLKHKATATREALTGVDWPLHSSMMMGTIPTFAAIVVAALYTVIFWGLRFAYWYSTQEAIFSDMADYVCVAKQIVTHFYFGCDASRQSFWTPVTPSFIAAAWVIGGANWEMTYRVIVQGLCFLGTLLLAFELIALTGRRWLGAALLFIVALSRPSIFWSLKISTESVSESLLICSAALALHCIRTRSISVAVLTGMAGMALALNRPQYFPPVMAVAGCLLVAAVIRRDRLRLAQVAAMAVGIAVVWSPWLIRNYLHHGTIVAFSTSGYLTSIWDYGAGPIRPGAYEELKLPDGTSIREFDIGKIGATLGAMPSDHERQVFARQAAAAWYRANINELPWLVAGRFQHFLAERGASALTTVSREVLFPSIAPRDLKLMTVSPLNLILVDKFALAWFAAFFGGIMLMWRSRLGGAALFCLWAPPWFILPFLINFERTVEPMTALTLWLALYFVAEAVLWLSSPRRATAAA